MGGFFSISKDARIDTCTSFFELFFQLQMLFSFSFLMLRQLSEPSTFLRIIIIIIIILNNYSDGFFRDILFSPAAPCCCSIFKFYFSQMKFFFTKNGNYLCGLFWAGV